MNLPQKHTRQEIVDIFRSHTAWGRHYYSPPLVIEDKIPGQFLVFTKFCNFVYVLCIPHCTFLNMFLNVFLLYFCFYLSLKEWRWGGVWGEKFRNKCISISESAAEEYNLQIVNSIRRIGWFQSLAENT